MDVSQLLAGIADLLSLLIIVALGRPLWQRRREAPAAVFLGLLVAFSISILYDLGDSISRSLSLLFYGPSVPSLALAINNLWPFSDAALVLAAAFWVHFFLIYPEPHALHRRVPWLLVVLYGSIGLVAASALVIPFLPGALQGELAGLAQVVDRAEWFVGAIALIGGFLLLLSSYRRARPGRARHVLRPLLIGFSMLVVLVFSTYVLPGLVGWPVPMDEFPLLKPFTLLLLLGTFTFAIVRYQLLNTRLVLGRSVAYAATTVALLLLYVALAVALVRVLGWSTGPDDPLLVAIFALLVTLLLNPLRIGAQALVDRVFYRQTYDYRQVLREFGQDLGRLQELPVLMQLILDRVVDTWQLGTAALVLREEEGEPYLVREIYGLPEKCLEISFSPEAEVVRRFLRRAQPLEWQREGEGAGLPVQERAAVESLLAVLIVPLQVKDRLIGWLLLGEKRSGQPYTPGDIELLGTLAAQATAALENAILYERRRREVAALEVLNRLGLVANVMELDDLLEHIYREVSRLVDTSNFYIALYREETHEFSYAYHVNNGVRQNVGENGRWLLGEGLTSEIVRTGEPIVTVDYLAECERRGVRPPGRDYRRQDLVWLGVPLLAESRVLGVMSISSSREGTVYRAEHVRLLSTIAAQAAVVIERTWLRQREQQRVAELEILREIAQAIGASIHLDELLQTVYRAVLRLLDAPNFYIALYDAARGEVTAALYAEDGQPTESLSRRWTVGEGLTGEIVRLRQPIITDDYLTECERRGVPPVGRPGRAWLGVPMMAGDEVIGVMVASTFSAETVFDEEDLRLLSTIAGQAATAVQNARLYEHTDAALSRRVEELIAIEEIARELNTTLDFRRILDVVLERAMAATAATSGVLGMVTADSLEMRLLTQRGFPPREEFNAVHPWSVEKGIMGRVVRTNRPALVADVRQDPDYADVVTSTRSALAVPIVYGGLPIGVLNLESDQVSAFDEEALRFLQRLADHAAIAINNAGLFQERERRITELAILDEIGRALSSALELSELLETVYQQVSRLFDVTNFYVAAYDEEAAEWATILDFEEGQRQDPTRYKVATGLTGYVIRARSPLLFRTGEELLAFESRERISPLGREAKSWLGVPLIAAGKVIGMMAIQNYEQEHLYNEQDLVIFSTIAAQAAIAIDKARLFRGVTEVRDRLQAILDSTRDGILMLGEKGRILLANPPVERWVGLPQDKIVGSTLLQLVRKAAPSHSEARRAMLEELKRGREALTGDPQDPLYGALDVSLGDAQAFAWLNLPVLDRAGRRIGRILILRDVTAARAAERLREDLVSMIVHDLRGPLAAILGAFETLLRKDTGPLTQVQRALLDVANEGGRHMQGMVNTLLDIRRLEAGRMPLSFAPVQLAEMAQKAVAQLVHLARERHLTIVMEIPPDLPAVRGDEEKIARVFENLLHNAVKYSYPGGLIRVRARKEGQTVVCSIADYGVGIPRAEQERVFEKFVQVHRTAAPRGTGLGLAFCRMAIEAHGGKIWVESEEGKGSTFYFAVPIWEGVGTDGGAARNGREK